jgi:serine/threonine-protein kinase
MNAVSKLPVTIGSRYIPIRVIGKGGMGVVYEVEHARTGERLALKVLLSSRGAPEDVLERFKREARAPAQIKSDNVVRVSDADVAPELDDAPFLVMELLEGMDLEQAALESKPDWSTVVGWLRQIAPALDKAHRLGIIHRDLKPENLFLATAEDRAPVVKILDFGIAKMASEGNAATTSGQVLGTPRYMAPEQAAHRPHITPATDRHALGLIAYRLIVGESYYRGDVMSILAEIMHGTLSAPSERNPKVGKPFDAWFFKACHRQPERRFASASEQVDALAEAFGLPPAPREPSRERLPSAPRISEFDVTLPSATVSHRFIDAGSRRSLAAGMMVLAAAAAALWYGASRRVDVSVPPKPSASVPASSNSLPIEFAETAVPYVVPEPPVPASASSSLVSDKPRPRIPRMSTSAAPPKAVVLDPFQDQK